mgnify:CR=1 FL=1
MSLFVTDYSRYSNAWLKKAFIVSLFSLTFSTASIASPEDDTPHPPKTTQENDTSIDLAEEIDFEEIYRPRPTNTLWEYNPNVSPEFYKDPYQVSLFNGQNGEDGERLWSQTKGVFAYGFGVIGVLAVMPSSVTNWESGEIFGKWGDNVTSGPVWDRDDWYLNVVGHAYFGGVYYQIARKSGYRQWDSFLYSVMGSTFYWEYGIEAFAEIPSIQDIVLTPVLGWVYGEWAYQTEQDILRDNGEVWGSETLGSVSLFFLDPIDFMSVGVNNLFGHEIFVAGTGYIDVKEVPLGLNGDTEDLVQMGVTYRFGSGKKKSSKMAYRPHYSAKDPVDTSIVGISYGYGYVQLDEYWNMADSDYFETTLGLYFSKEFSARLSYAKGYTDDSESGERVRYENYNVNAQYYFNTDSSFRPFVSAGFGETMRDKDRDQKTFNTLVGAGVHFQITKNIAFQTDTNYHYSTSKKIAENNVTARFIYRFNSGE